MPPFVWVNVFATCHVILYYSLSIKPVYVYWCFKSLPELFLTTSELLRCNNKCTVKTAEKCYISEERGSLTLKRDGGSLVYEQANWLYGCLQIWFGTVWISFEGL